MTIGGVRFLLTPGTLAEDSGPGGPPRNIVRLVPRGYFDLVYAHQSFPGWDDALRSARGAITLCTPICRDLPITYVASRIQSTGLAESITSRMPFGGLRDASFYTCDGLWHRTLVTAGDPPQ